MFLSFERCIFAKNFYFMKRFFLLIVLFFSVVLCQAQQFDAYVEMGKAFIDKPENIDSTRIYQLPARFCFALTSRAQMVGAFAYSDFNLNFYTEEGGFTLPAQTLSYLGERVCKKIGFEVGYGSMSFGYDVEIGQKSAKYKRSLSLGLSNLKWGARISYTGLSNYIISNMTIGKPGEPIYIDTTETSDGLGKMRILTLDGYYVFNSKRFGYTATNTINVVQKHTAGSFILTGRFMWCDLDTKEDMGGLFESYGSIQLAVGGGYSANIVLWNRDIVDNDDRTIRNLTWNITAMPVISFINYMQTRAIVETYDEYGELLSSESKKSDVWCYPSANLIGSTALSLTWGRFYFTSQFQLNFFYFNSQGAMNKNKFSAPNFQYEGLTEDVISDVKVHGLLYNWSLIGKLFYRF